MTTNNIVNVGLSGSTGTGNFVGSNSPTLVTPTLGAALATSVNFGGNSLSIYTESGTWTPTFTFATPGNLSVSYANQTGYYTQAGNIVVATCRLQWTPTHTTASGNAQIGGLPSTPLSTNSVEWISGGLDKSAFALPAGCTQVNMAANGAVITFLGSGTLTASANLVTTQFPTGVAQYVYFTITYLI